MRTTNLHKRNLEVSASLAVKLAICPAIAPGVKNGTSPRNQVEAATFAAKKVTTHATALRAVKRTRRPATTATKRVTFRAIATWRVPLRVANATNRDQSPATSATKKVTSPATALPSSTTTAEVAASAEVASATTADRKVTLLESAPANLVARPSRRRNRASNVAKKVTWSPTAHKTSEAPKQVNQDEKAWSER